MNGRGFTLIELLITIAIIGIVSALALPAYRTYVETANMSKVNSAYENAIRVVRQEYQKTVSRVSLGMPSTFPTDENEWLDILNPNAIEAPGGGPMYDTTGEQGNGKGKGKGKGKEQEIDYDATGAIRIDMPEHGKWVFIFRPAYGELKPLRARVSADDVKVEEL